VSDLVSGVLTRISELERLEAARQSPTSRQSAWDAHFDRMLGITSRAEPNPNRAASAAYARTEAQYGKRPGNEETT
jgi:hypothetical protein